MPQIVNVVRFFACFILLLSGFVLGETQEDISEAARLRIVEMIHDDGTETFRQMLSDKGHSVEEVDSILFDAFYAFGSCLVHAAREQAREQGISEEMLCPSSNKWNRRSDYLMESFAHHFHITRRIVGSAIDVSRWSFA